MSEAIQSRECSTASFSADEEMKKQHAYAVGGDCFRQGRAFHACPFPNDPMMKDEWEKGWKDQEDFWAC